MEAWTKGASVKVVPSGLIYSGRSTMDPERSATECQRGGRGRDGCKSFGLNRKNGIFNKCERENCGGSGL